jgi:hypothetical protein
MSLVAAVSERHTYSSAVSKQKYTSYKLYVWLDIHHKQGREHAINIVHALQIPEMMIDIILKSASEIETGC